MGGQSTTRDETPAPQGGSEEEIVDAVLGASRALVAVAARSLAGVAEDVTLPQYRTLVVLASRGPQRVAELADALGVLPSTATRMLDRLVAKGLVRRTRPANNRRSVRVALSAPGRSLVAEVTRRRREEITKVVHGLPLGAWDELVRALRLFADSAGEVSDRDWPWEWQEPPTANP
ncbi:MAG: MarR family winged helix-turn-helix transcriptional regulator [Frankia sp.]